MKLKIADFLDSRWFKPVTTLTMMGIVVWLTPSIPIDPWNLINPQKIVSMVFALVFIQIFGTVMGRILGARAGAILTGFFGGLVSSTATTASLARKSRSDAAVDPANSMLVFLSATGAMLLEAVLLVLTGTAAFHLSTLILFGGPVAATCIMIFIYSRKVPKSTLATDESPFEILPILKLSVFIVSILILSKLLQNIFGQNGLMVLTFLVSLFEIHGSVIANVQLHEMGSVPVELLNVLLAISVLASYLSKLFLVSTFGSRSLRIHVLRGSLVLFLSLGVSWMISR